MATDTKKEISYAEKLCGELKQQVKQLEKKLEEENALLDKSGGKQAVFTELREVQKLLKKHTEQLDHLRTHDSKPLKLITGLSLVIFVVWMIVVLSSNWKIGDK